MINPISHKTETMRIVSKHIFTNVFFMQKTFIVYATKMYILTKDYDRL